jgi:hypothetical protein
MGAEGPVSWPRADAGVACKRMHVRLWEVPRCSDRPASPPECVVAPHVVVLDGWDTDWAGERWCGPEPLLWAVRGPVVWSRAAEVRLMAAAGRLRLEGRDGE